MKRLKDPIYGYIDVDEKIIDSVVDTANFQRLRFVVQTSYSPLYSSAVHNRFVHSLGVLNLGKLVSVAIQDSISRRGILNDINTTRHIEIFQYACLLHDVGHAPFSHTGEGFYLEPDSSRQILHKEIVELLADADLADEIKAENYSAAPHELMSVIVSLKLYSDLFANIDEKRLFARCILGYPFVKGINEEKSFLNCLISMLNSDIIDVDKLDYLIRDAYITGYDTVSIDYKRLLKSVDIIGASNGFNLVFTQGAISVIENVVYAHDSERKWIQNHPTILYDAYLLKHAIEVINNKYRDFKIFSYDFLTEEGKALSQDLIIRLLSDADILFLMKNIESDNLVSEYFSRKNRRNTFWKSESEYKALFSPLCSDDSYKIIEDEFDSLSKYLNYLNGSSEINDASLIRLKNDIEKNQNLLKDPKQKTHHLEEQIRIKEKHLKWVNCLQEFKTTHDIDFDFLIIKANQFNSGFSKIGFENIKIKFPYLKEPCVFKEITNSLTSYKSDREKFFYLFYRRKDRNSKVSPTDLALLLVKMAIEESASNR